MMLITLAAIIFSIMLQIHEVAAEERPPYCNYMDCIDGAQTGDEDENVVTPVRITRTQTNNQNNPITPSAEAPASTTPNAQAQLKLTDAQLSLLHDATIATDEGEFVSQGWQSQAIPNSDQHNVYKDYGEGDAAYRVMVTPDGEIEYFDLNNGKPSGRLGGERLINARKEGENKKLEDILHQRRVEGGLQAQAWAESRAQNAVLNSLYSTVDRLLGDYSFGIPTAVCQGTKFNPIKVNAGGQEIFGLNGDSFHISTNQELFEEYIADVFQNLRITKVGGEFEEILPDQLYRYAYTLKISFERPGVEWETYLINDCDRDIEELGIYQGSSQRRDGQQFTDIVIEHFAGQIDDGSNLAAMTCEDDKPCKFTKVCVWLDGDEGTRYDERHCTELKNFQGRGARSVMCEQE